MQKFKSKIKEVRGETTVLEASGRTFEVPNDFLSKPKVDGTVVLTFATEREDALSAKEVAHELIKTALRGE